MRKHMNSRRYKGEIRMKNLVDSKLMAQIIAQFKTYEEWAKNHAGKEWLNQKREIVAHTLTQGIPVFVKHNDIIYMYNGKIYDEIYDSVEWHPILREICKNISKIIVGLEELTDMVKLFNNIFLKARTVEYPYDICNLIAFENGILNLNTMMLEPFYPGRFITTKVNVDWVCNGACPNFERLLDTYTQGDDVLKERIVEAMGMCLTNDTIEKIICFTGLPNTGKRFLTSLIVSLTGENSACILHPDDMKKLYGNIVKEYGIVACINIGESPLNVGNIATLKNIYRHDRMNFDDDYSFECKLGNHAHTIICTSHNITTEGKDSEFESMKLIIPFEHVFGEDAIPYEVLMQLLSTEISAIARRLVQGYINLRNKNYEFSGSSTYDSYIPV